MGFSVLSLFLGGGHRAVVTPSGSQPLGNSSPGQHTRIQSMLHIREDKMHDGGGVQMLWGFLGDLSGSGDCGDSTSFALVGVRQEEQKLRKIMRSVGLPARSPMNS